MTDSYAGKLTVALDRSTPGSDGRLYLQLPKELAELVGRRYRYHGRFHPEQVVTLVEHPDGTHTVTPRSQIWWKNGVRDHGIRENWYVDIYVCTPSILTVVLRGPTGDPLPELPPRQETLFG